MSRTSRLLLAPAAALVLLAFSPGAASAAPLPDPLGPLRDAAESLPDALTGALPGAGTAPQTPAQGGGGADPAAAVPDALEDAAGTLTGARPGGLPGGLPGGPPGGPPGNAAGGDGAGWTGSGDPAPGSGDPAGAALEDEPAPHPIAGLCDQVRDGLLGISPQLAAGFDQLCEAAEADPTEALQDLLEQLLAALPTGLGEGCRSLLDLIDQGGAALGVDPAPLRGLVEQLCALIPGEQPDPVPAPVAQPQHPTLHPVAQPQQHPQHAVVPVASSGGTGSGQLAYTGVDPKPYLAGGVVALGLGAGLVRLGRRRA